MEKVIFLTNASVVLVTKNHPPSATHDFLVKHKIIPEDFQVQGVPFYTHPFSQIRYNNGLCIATEPNRILLQTLKPAEKKEEQEDCLKLLEQASLKYVDFFSDIDCQSIGLNFQMMRDDLKFETFVERTVKLDSPFLVFENNSKGDVRTLNVSYTWRGKQLNMTINKVPKPELNPLSHPTNVALFDINVSYPNQYGDKSAIVKELKENFEKTQQFIGML